MSRRHVVPASLIVPGPPPVVRDGDKPPKCRTCDRPYTAHCGDLCMICRGSVEHHTNRREMQREIVAEIRQTEARIVGLEHSLATSRERMARLEDARQAVAA